MEDDEKAKPPLEIAHILFIDIVGYSTLLTDEQSEALQELNQIVRNTETVREAEAAGQLIILPTGDGMAWSSWVQWRGLPSAPWKSVGLFALSQACR
jgi:hypothetical protein